MAQLLDPTSGASHVERGVLYFQLGHLHLALTEFQDAVRLSPELATGHNNLGAVLARMGRFDEAESEFRVALGLLPEFPDALNNLSRLEEARRAGASPPSR